MIFFQISLKKKKIVGEKRQHKMMKRLEGRTIANGSQYTH